MQLTRLIDTDKETIIDTAIGKIMHKHSKILQICELTKPMRPIEVQEKEFTEEIKKIF